MTLRLDHGCKPPPSNGVFWRGSEAATGGPRADVRIHDLRHSFASFLVNAGRSLYEMHKILGRTQIETTQRFAHLSQDTLIDAANVVPFMMDLPMVAMVKAGSSGLMLELS